MTKKLAVIGYPIAHSFSPMLHNFISAEMRQDYKYDAIEVSPSELGSAVKKLKDTGISGFNVTAPHKLEIMKYLDVISKEAKRYGSVNTVVNRNGVLYGYNTDAEGFYRSLLYYGAEPRKADILVFGAGGAAQPAVMYLALKNAKSITVVNRTKERAEQLKRIIAADCGYEIYTEITKSHYDLIINCTSLGMGRNIGISPACEMPFADSASIAVDMIYNPEETAFLQLAKTRNARIINGLAMLIFQGILSYELFTGITLPENMADRIFKEVFGK